MLIVFGCLPGTGKTTVARKLVARLPSVYLRMDIILGQTAVPRLYAENIHYIAFRLIGEAF